MLGVEIGDQNVENPPLDDEFRLKIRAQIQVLDIKRQAPEAFQGDFIVVKVLKVEKQLVDYYESLVI